MTIERALVVIPARDEEALLPAHLVAVQTAVAHVRRHRPRVDVQVSVVLDSCTDDSLGVVAAHPWVHAMQVDLGVVGVVRAVGIDEAVHRADGELLVAPARTWVLCTDADTSPPPSWIADHVREADAGAGVVAGMVEPDPEGLDGTVLDRWHRQHRPRPDHPHVHGANLGFRLDHYQRVGGFAPLATGEDVDLVARMTRAGVPCARVARPPVRTSSRLVGRAPAGFAAYLVALGGG